MVKLKKKKKKKHYSIKLYNTHLARLKVIKVHYNGAVNTADQQRSVGGSVHKPPFYRLHMELIPTVPWLNAEGHNIVKQIPECVILCFVDHASLYNLINKTNFVHNLFLVYLSISTCFGRLCAHHQEKQLYLCDTWYLLFCVDDCLVCTPDSHPHRLINVLRINCAPSWLYLQELQECLHCIKWHCFNPLNAKLNPICHLLALLAHHILHVSRVRVKWHSCKQLPI